MESFLIRTNLAERIKNKQELKIFRLWHDVVIQFSVRLVWQCENIYVSYSYKMYFGWTSEIFMLIPFRKLDSI